jgi:hypothetical protein
MWLRHYIVSILPVRTRQFERLSGHVNYKGTAGRLPRTVLGTSSKLLRRFSQGTRNITLCDFYNVG